MKQTVILKKNDEIPLTITALTALGSGVGHHAGLTVFVENTAIGDEVLAHIIKVKATYAVGIIKKILTPSPDRIEPDCPVFAGCGGCAFRHLNYEAEKRAKLQQVQDALQRIVSTGETRRYRNKAQYPVGMTADGKTIIGFYAKRSHRIVDCRDCVLQPASFAPLLDIVAAWAAESGVAVYDEETGRGQLRHIYLRKGFHTDETMVCLVVTTPKLPRLDALCTRLTAADPTVKSVVLNINRAKTNVILGDICITVFGSDFIEDTLCGLRFRISPLSFYQVNPRGAEILYRKAADFAALTGSELLLDLYCGTGTIGLSMAHRAKQVVGVEIIAQAIENAKDNAARNGIENARFFCDDAAGAAKRLLFEGLRPDVVVLDPPRKGCSTDVIDAVSQMQPDRVVYVSCDPATLARDCKRFAALGYAVRRAAAVDMFPRTGHVEAVVLLVRKTPD